MWIDEKRFEDSNEMLNELTLSEDLDVKKVGCLIRYQNWNDKDIQVEYGEDVLKKVQSIKAQIKAVDDILKDIVGGYSVFRYRINDSIFFDYDYNHKNENADSFIGIGSLSLTEKLVADAA